MHGGGGGGAATKGGHKMYNSNTDMRRSPQQNERELNDLQQYSRKWNLRVFKVPEKEKETAADCTAKVCAILSDKVGIPITASDIEVAHRTGQRSSTRARPILVRFFDRKKRDSVLTSRRNLKNKGIVIGEDLTYANYQVFRKASDHSATMSVWSSNGKILAKVKNGRIVRVNIHTDLDEAFRRAMSGNEMSADEKEEIKLVSCVGAYVLALWKGRGKGVISC